MTLPEISFHPSADVKLMLNAVLDRLERRKASPTTQVPEPKPLRAVKIRIAEIGLPGYFSQIDPEPRQVANEQLQTLEKCGLLRLSWQAGENGHLLEAITLVPGNEAPLYRLVARTPTNHLRARLESLLLGEKFRFAEKDWRYRAVQYVLSQIKTGKSPVPFSLTDNAFNEDLITLLVALEQLNEETPFRVFSVHTFNDSKRFEDLKAAVIRLARLGHAEWKRLPADELLRELNLVANPTYLLLSGAWNLVDASGQVISLGEFHPSVGLPASQAAHLQKVAVLSKMVLCVENLTTFHSLSRSIAGLNRNEAALLCLSGNPSPALRWLLQCLTDSVSSDIPLYVWADLDYGGFNILAQLRKRISPRFLPYRMDVETLETCSQYARPLTKTDRDNLERLMRIPELQDMRPVISGMLRRGIKLEQEAIPI